VATYSSEGIYPFAPRGVPPSSPEGTTYLNAVGLVHEYPGAFSPTQRETSRGRYAYHQVAKATQAPKAATYSSEGIYPFVPCGVFHKAPKVATYPSEGIHPFASGRPPYLQSRRAMVGFVDGGEVVNLVFQVKKLAFGASFCFFCWRKGALRKPAILPLHPLKKSDIFERKICVKIFFIRSFHPFT
jgi:hypothetical protein